jgi:ankyrin repeat protein
MIRGKRVRGDKTLYGPPRFNSARDKYQLPTVVFREHSGPSPESSAESIEEDDYIGRNSYVPNDFSLSYDADTIASLKRREDVVQPPGSPVSTGDTNTFFTPRLQQLSKFRQLHEIAGDNDMVSILSSSISQPTDSVASNGPVDSEHLTMDQTYVMTETLPVAVRKDFVDDVHIINVLSRSSELSQPSSGSTDSGIKTDYSLTNGINSSSAESIVKYILSPTSASAAASPTTTSTTASKTDSEVATELSQTLRTSTTEKTSVPSNIKQWNNLHVAVIHGKIDDLLKNITDTDKFTKLFTSDTDGLTPLHWAVLKAHTTNGIVVVEDLLNKLVEKAKGGQGKPVSSKTIAEVIGIIQTKDNEGYTAMNWAIKQNNTVVARKIIEALLEISKLEPSGNEEETEPPFVVPKIVSPNDQVPVQFVDKKQKSQPSSIASLPDGVGSGTTVIPGMPRKLDDELSVLERSFNNINNKTTIMHLVAAEVSLFSGTPNNSQMSSASTLTSQQASPPPSEQVSTLTREESMSTLTNLIETNPGLIVFPDETGITPLHIMSRNLFSGVSSLTISQEERSLLDSIDELLGTPVTPSPTDAQSTSSLVSPLTQSEHFEQSKKILSEMIHTALPPNADEDFLNHLFDVTGSLEDLQGNNPLHELMASFGSSRMSSLTAFTEIIRLGDLTVPDVDVPQLQPIFYEPDGAVPGATATATDDAAAANANADDGDGAATNGKDAVDGADDGAVPAAAPTPVPGPLISFNDPDTRDSLLLVNESQPSLPGTRQSLLLIDMSKPTTIHITHSSETSVTLSKAQGIDKEFAKDFFTGESTDFSSVSDFLKDVMQTSDGVSLPFAEFKNQTNRQGYYPIDTLIDFMTTFDWYLVNNFKFKTQIKSKQSPVAMKPRPNVTAPAQLGILFGCLIPEDEQGNPIQPTKFVENFQIAGDGTLQSMQLNADIQRKLALGDMYDGIEGKFLIDVNGTVSFPGENELFEGKPDAYFQGKRFSINQYMNSIIDPANYTYRVPNENDELIESLRTQINPNQGQTYQFKIAFTKEGNDSRAHFICIESDPTPSAPLP